MIRNRILAECGYILSDGEPSYLETIRNVNEYFVSLARPKNLDIGSTESAAVKLEREFEETCIVLQVNHVANVKAMTVIEFWSALVYFEKKNKQNQK